MPQVVRLAAGEGRRPSPEREGFFDLLRVVSCEGRLKPPFSSSRSSTSTNPKQENMEGLQARNRRRSRNSAPSPFEIRLHASLLFGEVYKNLSNFHRRGFYKPLRLVRVLRPTVRSPTDQEVFNQMKAVFGVFYWSALISPSIQSWMINFISFLLIPAW